MNYYYTNYSFIKVLIVVLINVFIFVTPIFLIEFHKKRPLISRKHVKKIVLLWYIILLFFCLIIWLK